MKTLKTEFVEFIPMEISDGVIYISMPYKTAVHNCACGCGEKVVTRFSPNDWELTFDGNTVSLYPSIGNWSFPCKSHYFIRKSKIVDIPTRTLHTKVQELPTSVWKKIFSKRKSKKKKH